MKKSLSILTIMAVLFGITTLGTCADVAKIGIFDAQKIINESSAGKMIQNQLRIKFQDFQNKLKKEKDNLEEMKKALEREALVLSSEKSSEKKREFRIRVNDFKKMQQDYANEFKKLENQYKGKIISEILDIVKKIGKDEGYLLILDEKNGGVFFRQDYLDITDKIIKQYNMSVSKRSKKDN